MPRKRGPKPQRPKRPHLSIERNVKKRREIAYLAKKSRRERGLD